MALVSVKRKRKKKRKKRQPTEKQMIISEAKLLKKMMRSTKSERINRLRRLKLTDSTRIQSPYGHEQPQATVEEIS